VSRSVAFVTLAQTNESSEDIESHLEENKSNALQSPNADTLVYYMGRKDAAKIAQQLINRHSKEEGNQQFIAPHHHAETPVHILEAVSTPRERQWSSTLGELAKGAAEAWFDSSSPALIMVGEALRNSSNTNSDSASTEVDNRLQDSEVFANGRRRA
jgi:uroporphyrin-III C-methyltransferase